MASSRRIIGVDFSGAQQAGDHIWLTRGERVDGQLVVEACYPARELPNGGRERLQCLAALAECIGSEPNAAFGLDFPFGLPAEISPHDDWETFVGEFADTYDDPLDFHETCKAAGAALPGEHVEYLRRTEREAGAPWCAYNWRIKSQTYFGIGTVLADIVGEQRARVLPMQPPSMDLPWILEVCPSSTLGFHSLPRHGYKGSGHDCEQLRREIVEGLERNHVTLGEEVRATAIQDPRGDALDSLIAAEATSRAVSDVANMRPVGVEGQIFV